MTTHGESQEEQWLERDIDYLGNIRERLGDLAGFGSLANELIQNAEDAKATSITFSITDMELTVENDAKFSDCGQVREQRKCPWKSRGKPSCDWHNLTWIAAGQKRDREETIGKFGVGFLAVYQVTDYPEVISGRHWELHEDSTDGNKRIKVICTEGCDRCRDVDGTRFVLPFALDPKSKLRKELGQETVTYKELPDLTEALARAAPRALLFMRSLETVEVIRDGKVVTSVSRASEERGPVTTQVISGTEVDETWYLLQGDFRERGDDLRRGAPEAAIEAVRPASMRVAVPQNGQVRGRLYAGLPTGTFTDLPFHIDGSFFPSTDRKRVIFDSNDYRTEWNAAALATASNAVATHVRMLRELLGPVALWNLIQGVSKAAAAEPEDSGLEIEQFWEQLAAAARESPVALNAAGDWVKPSEAPVLRKEAEAEALEVLAAIDVVPMNSEIRPIVVQNLVVSALGTKWLGVEMVIAALEAAGFGKPRQRLAAPEPLNTIAGVSLLWRELDTLIADARAQRHMNESLEKRLRRLAIAPTAGGRLLRLADAYRADAATRQLVASLDGIALLDESIDGGADGLLDECPTVSVDAVVVALERTGEERLTELWQANEYEPVVLLEWLKPRVDELEDDEALMDRVRGVAAFPADDHLLPLASLSMKGDFQDPFDLSAIIDIPQLNQHRPVLEALGVRELSVNDFVRSHVQRAFLDKSPSPDITRKVVLVLANHVTVLEADRDARDILRDLPIIECLDGEFRRPGEVVQDSEEARRIIGSHGTVASLPREAPRRHQDLWDWLGVPSRPTVDQVLARVRALAEQDGPAEGDVASVSAICRYVNRHLEDPDFQGLASQLKDVAWLPERDKHGWYRPGELYATFRRYLFDTQALFLGLPQDVQREITPLLDRLGIGTEPSTAMIVAHVLECADLERADLNPQVWVELDRAAANDESAVFKLTNRECILVDGTFWVPSDVFWGGPNFGGRKLLLSDDMRRYRALFDAIGVRVQPSPRDAVSVLEEVAVSSSAGDHSPLEARERSAVDESWVLLGEAFLGEDDEGRSEAREVLPTLANIPCAVDRDGQLCQPTRLYVEDRADLPDRFPVAVRRRVVQYDPTVSPALRAAGSQDFSVAVDVAVLERGSDAPVDGLEDRLAPRWVSYWRAMASKGIAYGSIHQLADFTRRSTTDLLIRYELNAEPDHPATEPERLDAIYVPTERTLYVRSTANSPWRVCARELAIALCGPRDASKVAADFHEVLRAESAEDAEDALDELGIRRVSEAVESVAAPPEGATLDGLGEVPEEMGSVEEPSDPSAAIDEGERVSGHGGEETSTGTAQGGSGAPPGPGKQKAKGSKSSGKRKRGSKGSGNGPRPVLRSYLPSPSDEEREEDPEVTARRRATDQAAVDRALRYERESGREPEEMDHQNRGFDITSRLDGQVVRYIEVKGKSGAWLDASSGLSGPQHDFAVEKGDMYWLYVVENAGQPSEELHPIQDPIGQATLFGFDPGWAEVAWDPEAPFDDGELGDEEAPEAEDE